jgi:hypothetical protein
MSDDIMGEIEERTYRCLVCEVALDPEGEHALVELDPHGVGPGLRVGRVCEHCAPALAEKIEECDGGPA